MQELKINGIYKHFKGDYYLVEGIAKDSETQEELEIFPSKVVVLSFRSVGSQHVAQYILFAREILQVLVQPYCPVA